jgi:hypothetical protein
MGSAAYRPVNTPTSTIHYAPRAQATISIKAAIIVAASTLAVAGVVIALVR